MFARSRFVAGLVVGVGGLVGYAVATGQLAPFAAVQKEKTSPAAEKAPPPGSPAATTTIDGRYLPPPPPKFGGEINLNAYQSKPYWPPRVVPPKGAPNVLLDHDR